MKHSHTLSTIGIMVALFVQPVLFIGQTTLPVNDNHQKAIDPSVKSKITEWMANNGGLSFLENKGQMTDMNGKPAKNLLFKASGNGVDMYVTNSGLSYVFIKKEIHTKANKLGDKQTNITEQYCRADMELVGANIQKHNIIKEDESSTYNNYYLGNCPDGVLNVHSYQKITIKDIYPGIDWVLYTAAGADKEALKKAGLQYDFIVHPGASPSAIKLCYKWADEPKMQNDGSLKINIPMGNITEGTPVSYDIKSFEKIPTSYTVHGNEVTFALANYNKNKTLVIDPALYWSTYYGGTGTDAGNSLWSDGNHVWVTGNTTSANFPLTTLIGAYNQGSLTGATQNAFILCFTTNGIPVWATYYGGTSAGETDGGQSITGDANNIWVMVTTSSSATFPVANPNNYNWYQTYDTIYNNTGLTSGNVAAGKTKATPVNNCAVILEFNKAGVREYASYIGGTSGAGDSPRSISDDGTDVWYTGYASSTNFPVLYSAGYYHNTWTNNAITVIGEWSATTGNLLWSTYYGNGTAGSQLGQAISSDGTNIWLTGRGWNGDMPVTDPGGGAYYQATDPSGAYQQAYIAKISIATHTTSWCTYFGGTPVGAYNFGLGIFSNGKDVWVTGESSATAATFPGLNPGGGAYYQASAGGGTYDAFIAKFAISGVQKWATLYGGNGSTESAAGVNADNIGNVWVTGTTTSTNFPTLSQCGAYNSSSLGGTQNAFILQFDTVGVEKWATYLGGTSAGETDAGSSIFGDGLNVWATGNTISTTFPTHFLSGAYNQNANGGGEDAYLMNFPFISDTMETPANVSCFGGNNGSATVYVRAGSSPYTYSWTPSGGSGATGTGLTAGSYTVTVTDNCGNTASASVTITQPASALTITMSSQTNIVCNGGATGIATANVATGGTSPYTYSWTPSGGSNVSATGLTAGSYTITATDANACTATASVMITQPNALSVSAITTANVLCNGGNSGSASASASGGTLPYTYTWTPSGGNTDTAVSLAAGTYTITVQDSCGASATASVSISQPTLLTAAMGTPTNILCNGENTGSALVTAGGGTSPFTYSWTPSGGTNAMGTGLTAGSYTVTVSDINNCSATASAIITQPTAMVITKDSVNVNSTGACNGEASVNMSGGTGPYTYKWSPGGGTNDSINGKCQGTYCCTITDNNGCKDSTCITIINVTGIATISNSSAINIYPDPNKGYFTVTGLEQGQVIEMYNYMGQKLISTLVNNTTMNFDISNKTNGMYFIRIENTDGSLATEMKIIKTK